MTHNLHLWGVESDATRVTAKAEAVVNPQRNYLLGPSFPPDPRHHPRIEQMPPIPISYDDLRVQIENLYAANNVAVNVMLYGVHCATDPFQPFTIINAYPCCRSHNTLIHQVLEWAFVIYWAVHFSDGTVRPREHRPAITSAATDSCGVELGGARYLMTPNKEEIKQG